MLVKRAWRPCLGGVACYVQLANVDSLILYVHAVPAASVTVFIWFGC